MESSLNSVVVRDVLANKAKKEVSCIKMDNTVFDALVLMAEENIGAVMVTDEKGMMVGIFSERDYARNVYLKGKSSRDLTVKEVMTPLESVYRVKPETSIEDCMVLMTGKHVRHLPVFSDDKFVGIVSIGDVVKAVISPKNSDWFWVALWG